jgi:phospholipid transport system substrate-binding protein
MWHIRSALITILLFAVPYAGYASVTPDVLVETTITELIDQLQAQRPELEKDKLKLFEMVENVVVPHFEIQMIARLVLGKHWRAANDVQRSEFTEEFKKLMVRTYATALFEYTGKERMEIKPLRMKDGDQRVRVETTVILPSAPAVPVHYSFILTEDGNWKIYDIKIDGISLVTTYRSSYGQAVQSKGLDALINELKEKNNNLETTS